MPLYLSGCGLIFSWLRYVSGLGTVVWASVGSSSSISAWVQLAQRSRRVLFSCFSHGFD